VATGAEQRDGGVDADLASDIGETRRYLDTAASIIERSSDRAGFYAAMKEAYPERVNS
jgi:hypothetical protein